MRTHRCCLVVVLVMCLSGAAYAEHGQRMEISLHEYRSSSARVVRPRIRRSKHGTHFIAEMSTGFSLANTFGPAFAGLVGIGGRPSWTRLRFYLLGEFAYASTAEQVDLSPGDTTELRRSHRDLMGGLRVYMPIYGSLRIFGDVLGGGTLVSESLDVNDVNEAAQQWYPLLCLAGGIQARVLRHLSVGARVKAAFADHTDEAIAETAHSKVPSTRITATVGITLHF